MAKKDALDSGEEFTMQVDLGEDERLANLNLSDSVLCAAMFKETINKEPVLIYEDTCIAGKESTHNSNKIKYTQPPEICSYQNLFIPCILSSILWKTRCI